MPDLALANALGLVAKPEHGSADSGWAQDHNRAGEETTAGKFQ